MMLEEQERRLSTKDDCYGVVDSHSTVDERDGQHRALGARVRGSGTRDEASGLATIERPPFWREYTKSNPIILCSRSGDGVYGEYERY